MSDVDVDALRRRSPGPRVLVYLDQSALSALAREECDPAILASLSDEIRVGGVVCLRSHEHRDETLLAGRELWDQIDRLGDELSIGIGFRPKEEIEWNEVYAAAQAFLSRQAPRADALWDEAFDTDPQTPRDDLFFEFMGGSIRIRARFDPADWEQAEVEHERDKETPMAAVYDELRAAGYTYDEMARANLDAMVRWKLGPLFEPDWFLGETAKRHLEWIASADLAAPDIGAGSPYSRMMAFAIRRTQTEYFLERFPALTERAEEFRASDELRHLPTMAYPALLRAALAAHPSRRARRSDGYDIDHLTRGLSRCDVVTADSSMTSLCRERDLVPDGCELLGIRELADLPQAIDRARIRNAVS